MHSIQHSATHCIHNTHIIRCIFSMQCCGIIITVFSFTRVRFQNFLFFLFTYLTPSLCGYSFCLYDFYAVTEWNDMHCASITYRTYSIFLLVLNTKSVFVITYDDVHISHVLYMLTVFIIFIKLNIHIRFDYNSFFVANINLFVLTIWFHTIWRVDIGIKYCSHLFFTRLNHNLTVCNVASC